MPVCPRCQARSEALGAVCPNDGQHFIRDEALADSSRDALLGRALVQRFVLVKQLGKGAMGAVYEALRTTDQQRCAVKVLRPDIAKSGPVKKRFDREARILSHIKDGSDIGEGIDIFTAMSGTDSLTLTAFNESPNIVKFFDYGQDPDGTAFLAMEFIEGKPLGEYQPFSAFTLQDVIIVLDQLLAALAAAHSVDVVHRDLKPDNIILCLEPDRPAQLKVLDFGLAKLIGEEALTVLTKTGEIYGTPTYMAPEQASGDHPISPAVDVYAFGVIMYELLTGSPPFNAPTLAGLMMQHVMVPVPKPVLRPDIFISDSLQRFMLRCLEKDPRKRFSSGSAAQDAFASTDEIRYLLHHSPEVLSAGLGTR